MFIIPFHRYFTLSDPTIAYPFAVVERVSAPANIIYAGVLPLAFFILYSLIARPGFHKIHVTILGFIISITLASVVTDVIKNTAGRPRPDLIDRCKPTEGTSPTALLGIDICTTPHDRRLQDGWRSFPSGHSSFAFAGLGYLSLWLCGQLHVLRPRTDLARVLLVLAPLVGALLIALSRVADYRHDVYDVTAGSILGWTITWFSYRRYFRRLRDRKCDVPYPSRAEFARTVAANGATKQDIEAQRLKDADEFELDDLASSGEDDDDDDDEARPLAGSKKREDKDAGVGRSK